MTDVHDQPDPLPTPLAETAEKAPERAWENAPETATEKAADKVFGQPDQPTAPKPRAAKKERRKVRADRVFTEMLSAQSTALLKELHLLTRSGDLNADARRKLKQINHFCTLLQPGIEQVLKSHDNPVFVDAGAGNGYLAFAMYEVFLARGEFGELIGLDSRADLVARATERAGRLGFSRLSFAEAQISQAISAVASGGHEPLVRAPNAVVALHACDTATDDAITLGLLSDADLIAVVPCCQTEVFGLLKGRADAGPLSALWRTPFHRREFSAHLTNVIRCLVLEAAGYKVRATELVGWEHSLKNELIIARKHQRRNPRALRKLGKLLERMPPLPMKLLASLHPTLAPA